jgi:DNA-binding transcriptional ArsR family regulator
MGAEVTDIGARQGKWNALVRRARLGDPKKKAAALVVGSYADADGTSVRCGVARLAADCEMGYSTARRYMAWLREVGLIELVRLGNGKRGSRSDEYRLTIHPDTEKAISALSQAEYEDLVGGMRATNSKAEKARRMRSESADSEDDETSTALTQEVSAVAREPEEATALSSLGERSNGLLRSPMSELPPKEQRSPPTGGAPPPDPRRPEPPTASGSRLYVDRSISEPLTPAQDQQGDSLPRARGPSPAEHVAPVYDFFTREVS